MNGKKFPHKKVEVFFEENGITEYFILARTGENESVQLIRKYPQIELIGAIEIIKSKVLKNIAKPHKSKKI